MSNTYGYETGQNYGKLGPNDFSVGIGEFFNNVTGATRSAEISSNEAALQRNFEKYMSDTSYQRAVADMKKAGLNPAMMYASGGNQASTPSGASGSSQAGRGMDVLSHVSSIINSITSARRVDHFTGRNQMPDKTTAKAYSDLAEIVGAVADSLK